METVKSCNTRVLITSVDDVSLNGRESPPQLSDLGTEGLIIGNRVEVVAPDGTYDGGMEDVDGGFNLLGEEDVVIYRVQVPGGRVLQVASWELEAVE